MIVTKEKRREMVKKLVWDALKCCDYNVSRLARLVDVDCHTVRRWRDQGVEFGYFTGLTLSELVKNGGEDAFFDDDSPSHLIIFLFLWVCY